MRLVGFSHPFQILGDAVRRVGDPFQQIRGAIPQQPFAPFVRSFSYPQAARRRSRATQGSPEGEPLRNKGPNVLLSLDNREDVLIPTGRDFLVADVYTAYKRGRENLALPRQLVLQVRVARGRQAGWSPIRTIQQ